MDGLQFKLNEAALPDKPLGHESIPVKLIGAEASYEGQQNLGDISFTFGVETQAGVEAFNALSDKDDDGIAGAPNEDEMLTPPIILNKEQAWLKYRVATKAKVSAAAQFSAIGFKVDGSFGVVFTDFHVHNREESTREAVREDLTNLRFAGNPDDILKLKPHDALSYQVRGELSASVTLSWSDVFTANLNALSRLLKDGAALGIEIGGSVTLNLGLVDDFSLVFLNNGTNKTRVVIRKADTRELGVAAGFGLKVGFADPQAVENALNAFIKAVAGEEIAAIDAIMNKASLATLPELERKLIVGLFERLGIPAEEQPWNLLQTKWEELKKKATNAIQQIAKAKVEVGFKYEYSRTKTGETLLEVELDKPQLLEFHNDLMLCKTENLLARVAANPDALKQYLHQKTVVRSQAWGFTLGIGPWIKIGGVDKKKLTSVVREDRKNKRKLVAYQGVRAYTGSMPGEKDTWTSDFVAEMPGFSASPEPTTQEFDYGLHFRFEWEQKDLSESELELYLDHAILWRALNADQVNEVKARCRGGLEKKAQVSVEIKLENEALRKLLPVAAQATAADGARALARAMPYSSLFEARRNLRLREICYQPLWRFYFENDDSSSLKYYALAASDFIRKLTDIPDHTSLAAYEKGLENGPVNFSTFAGQIYYNGQDSDHDYSVIHDSWKSFLEGLQQLNQAITPGTKIPHQELEKVFKNLSRFWSQSLFVRAVGAFLVDVAARQGLLSRVERTFTVSPKDELPIIFSTSAR